MGHQCKNKELRVLLVEEDDCNEEEEIEHREVPLEVTEKVELSVNSVVGLTTPRTMKVEGTVGADGYCVNRLRGNSQFHITRVGPKDGDSDHGHHKLWGGIGL